MMIKQERRVVVREAILEGFNPFGEIAHKVRNLSFATEQKKDKSTNDRKVPYG